MARIKSRVEIRTPAMQEGQYIELQDRTDGFLLAGRGVEAEWNDEDSTALIKDISKKYDLDTGTINCFRKTLANHNLRDAYDSIIRIISAMAEFEKEKNISKVIHIRVPAHLKAKLTDKNTSELVRDLLEKHLGANYQK